MDIDEEINGLSNHYGWTYREKQRITDLITNKAKEVAIEFAEHLSKLKGLSPRMKDGIVLWYWNDGETVFEAKTETMYELFLQQRK